MASIAEGNIVIKGDGSSARNTKSEPEAWYDPSKAVTLEFILKDGRSETKKSVMPIHQSDSSPCKRSKHRFLACQLV